MSATPPLAARLAAAVALFVMGALVVALSVYVFNTASEIAVALVAVLLGLPAGWSVFVRQRWRPFWAAISLASLAAVITLLVTTAASVAAAVVAGAAIVVAESAGALALRREISELLRRRWQPGAPAQHPVLIMNPRSGGGKVQRYGLVEEARRRGIRPLLLGEGDDLRALAEKAVAGGADVIGMAGGDGSQAVVASVAAQHDVSFVCVPAGTRNHLALDLGILRTDVVGALDAFSSCREARIDLAVANGRVFVNNVSLGIYAEIVQSEAYRESKLSTVSEMLPRLLGPDSPRFDLRFAGPDGRPITSAQLVLVSNNPYRLERLAGFGTRARLDTGLLGIAAVRITGMSDVARLLALEAAGRIPEFPGWVAWSAKRFEVDSAGSIDAGVDGEATSFDPPLVFEMRPGALRVRIASHHPGLSPAAAYPGLSRVPIVGLARMVFGRPSGIIG